MDSSKKFDIKEFVKKPAVIIVGAILALILLFSLFFGGGDEDPVSKSVKSLSNRNQALITLIDQYSSDVKTATLKSNLSQVSIILTADKNDIDAYFKTMPKSSKKVTTSVSAKPNKELVQRLDQAKIANNLDSELKATVKAELGAIGRATEKLKSDNSGEQKLITLADKLIVNIQTMLTRIEER